MCVDDVEYNLIALEAFLTMMKEKHETYVDPEKALLAFEKSLNKKCCNKGYTFIITDIFMPVLNGFDLSKKMLELHQKKRMEDRTFKNAELTIVAVTASEDDEVEKKALKAGITKVIMKPLIHSKCVKIVDKYFKKNVVR